MTIEVNSFEAGEYWTSLRQLIQCIWYWKARWEIFNWQIFSRLTFVGRLEQCNWDPSVKSSTASPAQLLDLQCMKIDETNYINLKHELPHLDAAWLFNFIQYLLPSSHHMPVPRLDTAGSCITTSSHLYTSNVPPPFCPDAGVRPETPTIPLPNRCYSTH